MRMSTTAAAALALSSFVSASPLHQKRQNTCIVPTVMNLSTQQVEDSINQWNSDVNTVNNFLNQAPGLISANNPDALLAQAQQAFTNAQDEPYQLGTLMTQPGIGTDAFECAVTDLNNVFMEKVLVPLTTVISNPGDTATVQTNVETINAFRCCIVLPDVDIIFTDSASNSGIQGQVPDTVGRENACSNLICPPGCTSKDNGSFGPVSR
jgi:hypothetical protein